MLKKCWDFIQKENFSCGFHLLQFGNYWTDIDINQMQRQISVSKLKN